MATTTKNTEFNEDKRIAYEEEKKQEYLAWLEYELWVFENEADYEYSEPAK